MHTPGPWRPLEVARGIGVFDDDGQLIAGPGAYGLATGRANARLIAAAPKMLAALQLIAELHDNGLEPDVENWQFIDDTITAATKGQ